MFRVKVPKLEELLVEEWSTLRPNQAGIRYPSTILLSEPCLPYDFIRGDA